MNHVWMLFVYVVLNLNSSRIICKISIIIMSSFGGQKKDDYLVLTTPVVKLSFWSAGVTPEKKWFHHRWCLIFLLVDVDKCRFLKLPGFNFSISHVLSEKLFLTVGHHPFLNFPIALLVCYFLLLYYERNWFLILSKFHSRSLNLSSSVR
jgi:hypothetical protein